jgi:uncharacterized protein
VLRRLTVPLPGWRGSPLRVGILSDVHAALPLMPPARVAGIARRLLAERPDLVLLPGDFVTTKTRLVRRVPVGPVAAALAALPTAAPTLAVLGNHDHHAGAAAALEGVGIAVLRNTARRLELPGGPLWVAGLDDMFTRRDDLGQTLAAVDRTAPVIMLSHVPDVFPRLPPWVPLTVAGHTHGGQVRLPGWGPIVTMSRLPRAMAYGLHERDGRRLYVSGGVGTTGWPVRFCRPPEIAILRLEAAP